MTQINRLPSSETASPSDQIPFYSNQNGRDGRFSVQALAAYLASTFEGTADRVIYDTYSDALGDIVRIGDGYTIIVRADENADPPDTGLTTYYTKTGGVLVFQGLLETLRTDLLSDDSGLGADLVANVVRRYPTAAAVRAINFGATNGGVLIEGSDGGLFRRVPTDLSSAEDGGTFAGTVIRPLDYATNGVLRRVDDQLEISLAEFGADATGSTSSNAIFATIASSYPTNPVRLRVPAGTYRISADYTIPNNITLVFTGGMLRPDNGVTLTIGNGGVDADPTAKIFDNATWISGTFDATTPGRIRFTNARIREVYSEWWGAAGDGVTNDSDPINAGLVAAVTNDARRMIPMRLLSKQYQANIVIPPYTAADTFPKNRSLFGSGRGTRVIAANTASPAVLFDASTGTANRNALLEIDDFFVGMGSSTSGVETVKLVGGVPFTRSITTTAGNTSVTTSDTSDLREGQVVTASTLFDITVVYTIASIDSPTTFTLSYPALNAGTANATFGVNARLYGSMTNLWVANSRFNSGGGDCIRIENHLGFFFYNINTEDGRRSFVSMNGSNLRVYGMHGRFNGGGLMYVEGGAGNSFFGMRQEDGNFATNDNDLPLVHIKDSSNNSVYGLQNEGRNSIINCIKLEGTGNATASSCNGNSFFGVNLASPQRSTTSAGAAIVTSIVNMVGNVRGTKIYGGASTYVTDNNADGFDILMQANGAGAVPLDNEIDMLMVEANASYPRVSIPANAYGNRIKLKDPRSVDVWTFGTSLDVTANTTLTEFVDGMSFSNFGAAGSVTLTQPHARVGAIQKHTKMENQIFRIDPFTSGNASTYSVTTGSPGLILQGLSYQDINVGDVIAGTGAVSGAFAAGTEVLSKRQNFKNVTATTVVRSITTTSASAVITLADTTGIIAGDAITATGVPTGTDVLTVDSPTQITMTANATASATVTGTFGKRAVTMLNTSGIVVGDHIQRPAGGGIQTLTTVASVDSGTQVTLSKGVTQAFVRSVCTFSMLTMNANSAVTATSAGGGFTFSQKIRGGGGGKYLQLTNVGDSVTLQCFRPGVWEIVSQIGTPTFEP